jgi:hypothetical protein
VGRPSDSLERCPRAVQIQRVIVRRLQSENAAAFYPRGVMTAALRGEKAIGKPL